MGLPLTWVTLNLMQLFWIDFAYSLQPFGPGDKLSPLEKEEIKRSSNPHHETRICGDDLGAYWHPEVNRRYN